ncbi:MAG: hypothetical protein NZ937_02300 [Armatimonadetes bacterium]|nr:hypothetical protein [Armatimonadota bacterium]
MAAYAEIEVIGLRLSEKLTAIIDTGFDGAICLPISIAVTLGLELVGWEFVQYADGRIARELLFRGTVQFQDSIFEVNISLTESNEALIGLEMLRGYKMVLDGDTHQVQFRRKQTR